MSKFIAIYRAPAHVLESWLQTDPEVRKPAEEKMQAEWKTWLAENAGKVSDTAGTGKTKRVTSDGIEDSKNDIMMYSIVEAESHEDAAKMFEGHPHFGVPEASIDIMSVNSLSGMV